MVFSIILQVMMVTEGPVLSTQMQPSARWLNRHWEGTRAKQKWFTEPSEHGPTGTISLVAPTFGALGTDCALRLIQHGILERKTPVLGKRDLVLCSPGCAGSRGGGITAYCGGNCLQPLQTCPAGLLKPAAMFQSHPALLKDWHRGSPTASLLEPLRSSISRPCSTCSLCLQCPLHPSLTIISRNKTLKLCLNCHCCKKSC